MASLLRSFNTLASALKSGAEVALKTSTKIRRDLKAFFSSDFEVLLLQLTKPGE
jgi:hypothetical protein